MQEGEGGQEHQLLWQVLLVVGVFGTCLFYGDGVITPAITVLGAVEGLNVLTPLFEPYVGQITPVLVQVMLYLSPVAYAVSTVPSRAVATDSAGGVAVARAARQDAGRSPQGLIRAKLPAGCARRPAVTAAQAKIPAARLTGISVSMLRSMFSEAPGRVPKSRFSPSINSGVFRLS